MPRGRPTLARNGASGESWPLPPSAAAPGDRQVALPKMALTGMAWQGYYLDTEGNVFGIHQPDPEAK